MLQLNYRDTRPIYTQIIDGYRSQITAGVLLPGDKLPSVRELAAQLSINPNTIQRAYRQLEMEGWITTVPGKGCFVCSCASARHRERERLLQILEETADALAELGMTRQELAARLTGEEHNHA